MAEWKKVVVSGSAADLASLTLGTALPVGSGGTGKDSLTDGGVLLGSGAGAVTALGQASNGQLVIGSTGADPSLATLGDTNGILATTGAGSLSIGIQTVGAGNLINAQTDGTALTVATTDRILLSDQSTASGTLNYVQISQLTAAIGGGTVTSVSATGTENGLTLTANNSSATTPIITLGGALANVANSQLTNDSVTIGTTEIDLGTSATTIGGLISVTSTDFTGSLKGNATTATTATTANGVAPNSVALGTDTTGNYVASLGTGTGVTIGSNTGETSSPTIAVDYGSAVSTAVQGNTTITVNVAAGELTRDVGSAAQALGGAPSYTLGLADSISGNRIFTGDQITIANDLVVQGTASFQNTSNLNVADQFILLNSGSTTDNSPGGIVVQQNVQDVGVVLGYDAAAGGNAGRWGTKDGQDASSNTFTANAYLSYVIDIDAGQSDIALYQKRGNIKIDASDDIFIYT